MAPRRRMEAPPRPGPQLRREAPPGVNPLFYDVPSVVWRLSKKPKALLRSHKEVFDWLRKKLREMIEAGVFVVKIEKDGKESTFQFHLLPQKVGSFFKVNLKIRGSPPVPLLFSLHNLYLLGFEHANLWHVFDDADLSGSGHDLEQNKKYWVKLGMSGRYHGNMFSEVQIGVPEIYSIYHVLSRYQQFKAQGKHDLVDVALFRLMVVLPEAWRFPGWRACLYHTFQARRAVNEYESLFKIWKKLCKRVLAGEEGFQSLGVLEGYDEYALVLPVVSIVIRPLIRIVM